MAANTPAISHEQLVPVRNYLQNVARVIGKFQQAFLAPRPYDAHYGLLITKDGLASQPIMVDGESMQIVLDMRAGQVAFGNESWPLANYSPERLMQELRSWLAKKGLEEQVDNPLYIQSPTHFDAAIAADIADVFGWAEALFEEVEADLTTGKASPILVFPHHFDLSLSWFPKDSLQYTLGFLFGDATISEPYLYVTSYPEPADFTIRKLPEPAFWQQQDFSGAILKCQDIAALDSPTARAREFILAALSLPGTRIE